VTCLSPKLFLNSEQTCGEKNSPFIANLGQRNLVTYNLVMFEYSLHCVLVPANDKPVPFVEAFFEVLYDIRAGDRAEFSEKVSQILLFDKWPEPADEDFEVFSVHLPGNISFRIVYKIPFTSVQKNALF
jgi:hypothetical protein